VIFSTPIRSLSKEDVFYILRGKITVISDQSIIKEVYMESLSESQKARRAISSFKTLADAVLMRGEYSPNGRSGKALELALKQINPEIYGSMNDNRIAELKGLEYVIDRMPKGIENATKIILTAQEDFDHTAFKPIVPLKRRRVSYVMAEHEMCFVITRGATELYDILTHITFLQIESSKIADQVVRPDGSLSSEWEKLEKIVQAHSTLEGEGLDKAIWNLSILLGRTYKETRECYEYLENTHKEKDANSGLFAIIYNLVLHKIDEKREPEKALIVQFTPSLNEMIGHHRYASLWAAAIKKNLLSHNLHSREIHIISANLHSIKNVLYISGWLQSVHDKDSLSGNIYELVYEHRDNAEKICQYAQKNGLYLCKDESGSNIDVQIIDTEKVQFDSFHQNLGIDLDIVQDNKPVLLVMDYAFGIQAFELMDELLQPEILDSHEIHLDVCSISIMGKAGILEGDKGDVMLATSHVLEGTANNYIVDNDLSEDDFDNEVTCFTGPMVTVLGTSLQNKAVLERFHKSSWRAVGLEMEGGHYQRAINGAKIRKFIRKDVQTRYAYYASDNPLKSGETLAYGPMGAEGILPTYKITSVILKKILNKE
jgi:hypothetical protein